MDRILMACHTGLSCEKLVWLMAFSAFIKTKQTHRIAILQYVLLMYQIELLALMQLLAVWLLENIDNATIIQLLWHM